MCCFIKSNVELTVSDLGNIFDIFSNEDDDNKRNRKNDNSQNQEPENDWKSSVKGTLSKNRPLLIITVVAGLAILVGAVFFVIKYIDASEVKAVIDTVAPFIK
jgi:hypothetical protein